MPTPLTPQTTILDDAPLVEKRKALVITGGQDVALSWVMTDDSGRPIDLTAYIPTTPPPLEDGQSANPAYDATITGPPFPPVVARVAEAVANKLGWLNIYGTIADAPNGVVALRIDARNRLAPGVYNLDVGVIVQSSGFPAYVNRTYLVVERSGFTFDTGPPTLKEIRLYLRDSSPREKRLLDEVLFDDADLASAIVRAIEFWNDSLPPTDMADTLAFPFTSKWKEAIMASLLETASNWYLANKLTSSAGGTQVNDMDKGEICATLAEKKWQAYGQWVQKMKVAINVRGGFGSIGSPYGLRGWGGRGY
jgi:hypothetical protein